MRKKGVNFEVKFVSKYGAGNIAEGVIESFGDEVLQRVLVDPLALRH